MLCCIKLGTFLSIDSICFHYPILEKCNGKFASRSINFNMIVETTFYALGLHFYVERKFKTIYFGHFSPASKRKSNSANYFNRLLLLRGKSPTHCASHLSSICGPWIFICLNWFQDAFLSHKGDLQENRRLYNRIDRGTL